MVDVVPGLYDRETFRRRLTESAALARPLAGVAAAEARSRVREHHRAAAARSALGRAIDPFAKGAIEGPVEEALAPPRPPPRVVGTDVLIERLAEGDVGGNAGNAPPERRTGTPVTTLRNVSSSRSLSKSGIETPVERVVSPTPSKRLVEGSTEARIDTRRTAAFPDLSRDTENNEQNRRAGDPPAARRPARRDGGRADEDGLPRRARGRPRRPAPRARRHALRDVPLRALRYRSSPRRAGLRSRPAFGYRRRDGRSRSVRVPGDRLARRRAAVRAESMRTGRRPSRSPAVAGGCGRGCGGSRSGSSSSSCCSQSRGFSACRCSAA